MDVSTALQLLFKLNGEPMSHNVNMDSVNPFAPALND